MESPRFFYDPIPLINGPIKFRLPSNELCYVLVRGMNIIKLNSPETDISTIVKSSEDSFVDFSLYLVQSFDNIRSNIFVKKLALYKRYNNTLDEIQKCFYKLYMLKHLFDPSVLDLMIETYYYHACKISLNYNLFIYKLRNDEIKYLMDMFLDVKDPKKFEWIENIFKKYYYSFTNPRKGNKFFRDLNNPRFIHFIDTDKAKFLLSLSQNEGIGLFRFIDSTKHIEFIYRKDKQNFVNIKDNHTRHIETDVNIKYILLPVMCKQNTLRYIPKRNFLQFIRNRGNKFDVKEFDAKIIETNPSCLIPIKEDSPIKTHVIDISRCKIKGDGIEFERVFINQLNNFTIETFSQYGPIKHGGYNFEIKISKLDKEFFVNVDKIDCSYKTDEKSSIAENIIIHCNDNNDGTYSVTYIGTIVGFYQIQVNLINSNGSQELPGSPFKISMRDLNSNPLSIDNYLSITESEYYNIELKQQADIRNRNYEIFSTFVNYYNNDDKIIKQANNVFSVWQTNSIKTTTKKKGMCKLLLERSEKKYNLSKQDVLSNHYVGDCGTAFLVTKNLLVVTGISFENNSLDNYRFISNFSSKYIPEDVIYRGVNIKYKSPQFSIVKLDRTVNFEIAKITKRIYPIDHQPLNIIGHALGLPKRIGINSSNTIYSTKLNGTFEAQFNILTASIGSPVFNTSTGNLEGFIIEGKPDFIKVNDKLRLLKYPLGRKTFICLDINIIREIINHIVHSDL